MAEQTERAFTLLDQLEALPWSTGKCGAHAEEQDRDWKGRQEAQSKMGVLIGKGDYILPDKD